MRPTHFEIKTNDPKKTENFYKDIFGWKFEKWKTPKDSPDYWLIMTGKESGETPGINGGMSREAPTAPITIEVKDINEVTKKIEKMGGKIIAPKMKVPTVGWMIYFEDLDGNKFGAMQMNQNAMMQAPM